MPPTHTIRQNGWTIRELRKGRGLTIAAFAEKLDILPQSLSNIERETKSVSTRLAERIARHLGVRLEVIDRDSRPIRESSEVDSNPPRPAAEQVRV